MDQLIDDLVIHGRTEGFTLESPSFPQWRSEWRYLVLIENKNLKRKARTLLKGMYYFLPFEHKIREFLFQEQNTFQKT